MHVCPLKTPTEVEHSWVLAVPRSFRSACFCLMGRGKESSWSFIMLNLVVNS